MTPARSPEATSAAIDTNLRELIGICQQTIRAAEEALGTEAPAGELAELRDRVAAYENAINWGTSCLSCATVLDSSIREHERAERATETERERIAKRADECDAVYPVTREDTYGQEYEVGVSFADLIREEAPGD